MTRITPKQKLPDKMSELLTIAMLDLEKAENTPRYTIDMSAWHEPNGHCRVCLAGSVMAMRLGVEDTVSATPGSMADADTRRKLSAINSLRCGDIRSAYSVMNKSLPLQFQKLVDEKNNLLAPMRFVPGVDSWGDENTDFLDRMSDSKSRREEWKLYMADMIGILEAEGL